MNEPKTLLSAVRELLRALRCVKRLMGEWLVENRSGTHDIFMPTAERRVYSVLTLSSVVFLIYVPPLPGAQ